MRAVSMRLDRLEERFGLAGRTGPSVESWETRHLRMRLEAARLRSGSSPISLERQAELKGRSVAEILNSGGRAAERQRGFGTTAPEFDVVPHLRPSILAQDNGP
jgi:hypothetical protein